MFLEEFLEANRSGLEVGFFFVEISEGDKNKGCDQHKHGKESKIRSAFKFSASTDRGFHLKEERLLGFGLFFFN
ncbi:hypothetical protein N8619_02885, partial [Akkermansiaceae bacterium]|nr:hypothetical protein [Akkermansiaceae bacterium]